EASPGVHRIDQALCDPISERCENVAFVTEILIDGGTRHPCPPRDVGDGGLMEPLAGDDLEGSSEDLVPACLCPIRELLISDLLHAITRDTDMSVCDHQYCSRPGIDVKRHEARRTRKSVRAGDRGQAPPTPGTGGVVPGTLKPGSCSDPAGDRVCSAMDYARLGHSGLKVSRLCLGTMTLGRWGTDDPAASPP